MPRLPTMARSRLCLAALLTGLTLAACAQDPSRQSPRVQYVTSEIPASLRDCKKAPSWAALEARARKQQRNATQAEVAEFIALLSSAQQNCRTKLTAVDRLLRKVEARTKRG